jgi:hypothetical protein
MREKRESMGQCVAVAWPLPAHRQAIASPSPAHRQPTASSSPAHRQPIASSSPAHRQRIASSSPAHRQLMFSLSPAHSPAHRQLIASSSPPSIAHSRRNVRCVAHKGPPTNCWLCNRQQLCQSCSIPRDVRCLEPSTWRVLLRQVGVGDLAGLLEGGAPVPAAGVYGDLNRPALPKQTHTGPDFDGNRAACARVDLSRDRGASLLKTLTLSHGCYGPGAHPPRALGLHGAPVHQCPGLLWCICTVACGMGAPGSGLTRTDLVGLEHMAVQVQFAMVHFAQGLGVRCTAADEEGFMCEPCRSTHFMCVTELCYMAGAQCCRGETDPWEGCSSLARA